MPVDHPARTRAPAPSPPAPVGRRARPTGAGLPISAAVLVAVLLVVVLWLLAVLEDRARRRAGLARTGAVLRGVRVLSGAGVRDMGRRVGATLLAASLLAGAAAVAPGAASAAPTATGSSGQDAGPTYVTQDWLAYVVDGGTLDVDLVVPAGPGTNGAAHATVTEPPGALHVVAASPAGREHTVSAPWDTATGARVAGTLGPDGGAGVWRLQLTATTASGEAWPQAWAAYLSVDSWSIAPRDPTGMARPGRVWTETYYQSEGAMTLRGLSRWDQTHWLLSDTGVTYRVDQRGFNGYNSRMVVDDLGLTDNDCQPIYRSASMGERGVRLGFTCPEARLFRIFFDEPDATMPATARSHTGAQTWVMPRYVSPSIPGLTWSQTAPGASWGGDLGVTLAGQAGTVEVLIDVDDDGSFDGDRDVRFEQVLPLGTTAIGWDGLDGAGDPVPLSQGVRFLAQLARFGEIHFTQSDVEYREGGIEVLALTGPQAGSRALWWDDSTLPGCHRDNLSNGLAECDGEVPPLVGDGVDSTGGTHRWGAGFSGTSITYDRTTWGDGKYIDDWTYHHDDATSEVLRLAGDIDIVKTADTDSVLTGEQTAHTWTVSNAGDVDLLDVQVVDDLSGVLPAGVIDAQSVVATAGALDLDLQAQTLTWSGDLPVDAVASVTYTLQVDAGVPVGRIVDTVTVTGWSARSSVTQTISEPPPATPTPTPAPAGAVPGPAGGQETAAAPEAGELAVTGAVIWAAAATAAALLIAGVAAHRYANRRRAGAATDPGAPDRDGEMS